MRSGSAVSVRCSVPELNSSVASHTPRTIVATQPDSPVTVRGTETYLIGFDGATTSRTMPAISVTAARAAAV